MIADNFDALLTFDKNLQYQQNFSKYTIAVFVLSAPINTYSVLTALSEQIRQYIDSGKLTVGTVVIQAT